MSRRVSSFLVIAALAGVAQPSRAVCPGTDLCQLTPCPKEAIQILPSKAWGLNPIQAAIDAASGPVSLCVFPGTYTGPFDFLGKKIALYSAAGPAQTILTAPPGTPIVTFHSGEGPDSLLDGFTLQNGVAPFGAGILISNASPTLRNCVLSGNAASGDPHSKGGGMWIGGASAKPVLRCTLFLGNSSGYSGGGLSSTYAADPYVRSCRFEGNRAPYGAAISVAFGGRLDLGFTAFLDNQASGDGGAIHAGLTDGGVVAHQCWFKGNSSNGAGGAIWVPAGVVHVANATFDGNRSAQGGAVASGYDGTVAVWSSLFVNNTTSFSGSGALDAVSAPYPSVTVNQYNLFWTNAGGASANTVGNQGVLAAANPLLNVCCPGPGSPAIDAGFPGFHYDDANGTRNDIGACGGPSFQQ